MQRLIRATQMVTEDVKPKGGDDDGWGGNSGGNSQDHNASLPMATRAAYATRMKEFGAFYLEWLMDQVGQTQRSVEEINR